MSTGPTPINVIEKLNIQGLTLANAHDANLAKCADINGQLSAYYKTLSQAGITPTPAPVSMPWVVVDNAQAAAIFEETQSAEQLQLGQPKNPDESIQTITQALNTITIAIPPMTVEVDVTADNQPVFKPYDGRFGILPSTGPSHPASIVNQTAQAQAQSTDLLTQLSANLTPQEISNLTVILKSLANSGGHLA